MEGIANEDHCACRLGPMLLTLVLVSLSRVPVDVRQPQEFLEQKKSEQARQHDQSDLLGGIVRHRFWKKANECGAQKRAHGISEQNCFQADVQLGEGDKRSRSSQGADASEQAEDQYVI
jgi:hypothetical protein